MPNLSCYKMQESLEETNHTPKIMVVDDDASVRRLLCRMLKVNGNECTLAACAEEARSYISKQKFDLILCDLKMPGESGMDFIKYILTEHPDTAVIMVTGVDDPEIAEAAMNIGAYGYIIKPFNPNSVTINTSNALRRRNLEIQQRFHRERLDSIVSVWSNWLLSAPPRFRACWKNLVKLTKGLFRPWHLPLNQGILIQPVINGA